VVTDGSQNVSGGDALDPVKATLMGPCRVVPLEYPALNCRAIDIVLSDGDPHQVVDRLFAEIISADDAETVALRGARRWVPSYERLAAPQPDAGRRRLRENGAYLITGGLGGLGLAIANHLARTVRARLVLLSRSGLPPREEWPRLLEEGHDEGIRQVLALEALGAEVLVVAADVTRLADVEAAVGQALARFGRLDGVVHAAGVPGIGLMHFKTPDQADRVLAPKVQGTLVLAHVLRDISLDFLVLFSSISSITGGGPGQVDYCAANAFLDAFAQRDHSRHGSTVAVNWSEWQWNAWDNALSGHDETARAFFRENRQRVGITEDEGGEAFERVLASGLPHVVVATQDFPSILRLSRQFSIATLLQQTRHTRRDGRMHPRPPLPTPYVAPTTDLERSIAAKWSDALGIAEVGIHDNFFELGGNSLNGVDLIARLRRELGAERLAPHVLYEAPTVSALARLLDSPDAATRVGDRHERGERRRANLQQRRMRA
jgi:NAD(P)-dependent dehydrogenase (short-subunit alcohol dehydrogenase family)